MISIDELNSLKNLTHLETYVYYNQPILMSLVDPNGQLYVGVYVDEINSFDTWLYAQISRETLNYFNDSKISIKNIFKKSESGFIYKIEKDYKSEEKFTKLKVDEIDDDYLPAEYIFLNNN